MNRITKFSFCFISVLVILFSMCPISAFAEADIYYPIASDKPTVTDYSGYVELLFEHKSTGQRFVTVLGWFFTPYMNSSPTDFYETYDKPVLTIVRNESQFRLGVSTQDGVSGNISFLTIDSASQLYFGYLDIPDDEATYYYPVTYGTNYALVGMHYYGDFADVNVDNALANEEFYVTYGADTVISYGLNQLISGMYTMIDLLDNELYKEQLDTIISNLNSIDTSLSDWKSQYETNMTRLLMQFQSVINYLYNDLATDLDSILTNQSELFDLVFNLWNTCENIYYFMPFIYDELLSVNTKLQKIIDLLSVESDIPAEQLTQPDNSDMDNYYDVENGLLDSGNADVGGAVNVQVNQNALTVIWDMVERALNTHSKVFGMVLTILSLGIIALILGR